MSDPILAPFEIVPLRYVVSLYLIILLSVLLLIVSSRIAYGHHDQELQFIDGAESHDLYIGQMNKDIEDAKRDLQLSLQTSKTDTLHWYISWFNSYKSAEEIIQFQLASKAEAQSYRKQLTEVSAMEHKEFHFWLKITIFILICTIFWMAVLIKMFTKRLPQSN